MDDFYSGFGVAMLLAVVVLAIVLVVSIGADDLRNFELPQCQEDQVLVGSGAFLDGYWDEYKCGPSLDDLGGAPGR